MPAKKFPKEIEDAIRANQYWEPQGIAHFRLVRAGALGLKYHAQELQRLVKKLDLSDERALASDLLGLIRAMVARLNWLAKAGKLADAPRYHEDWPINYAPDAGKGASKWEAAKHTAVGSDALQNCIAAPDFAGNTAVGTQALFSDTTGNFNTAIGDAAMKLNTTGAVNTAVGLDALVFNTVGDQNVAVGGNALFTNDSGVGNTAVGTNALINQTTGNLNTAVGVAVLTPNTTGASNTGVGANALISATTGSFNTALGNSAGSGVNTANNVLCLGASVAGADVSNTTWIGNVFNVTPISGTTAPVVVSDGGQLGTLPSSERFKKDIATMEKASEAILSLRPVTFHYKTDVKETAQFGLVAEEVAKVNPALVLPDKEGKPYTVRYDAVNAMLLNEFLKEHRKVEQLEKQVEKLTAGLQKVSAELQVSKPAPQVVTSKP